MESVLLWKSFWMAPAHCPSMLTIQGTSTLMEVVCLKAETFVHYTYVKSGTKLMVVDIQGKGYHLCDPEIASADLRDANDQTILFCSGNLSYTAIERFKEVHVCNEYCTLLKLDKE